MTMMMTTMITMINDFIEEMFILQIHRHPKRTSSMKCIQSYVYKQIVAWNYKSNGISAFSCLKCLRISESENVFDFITILWLEITILFQVWKLNYDNANLLGNAYIRNCTFQIVAWRIKKLRNLSILDVWHDSGLQNPKMNWFHNNSLSGFKVNCIQTLNPEWCEHDVELRHWVLGLLLRVVPRGPRHCICKQICCIRITSRLGSLSKSTTELNLIWKIIKHVYKANCCLGHKS